MKKLAAAALGLALTCGLPVIAQAQSQSSVDTQRVAEQADREDKGEWGWIGLIGLVGLIGLKRRDRDPAVRTAAASTTR